MYVRPHLEYGDVIFHNQGAELMKVIERVQYKAALLVSGCWQGTSQDKLHDELGWDWLSDRRWTRRLSIFYKISNGFAPSHLSDHIPKRNVTSMSLRSRPGNHPLTKTERYEKSFFPFTINTWKELDEKAKSKTSVLSFKKYLQQYLMVILFLGYVTNLGV